MVSTGKASLVALVLALAGCGGGSGGGGSGGGGGSSGSTLALLAGDMHGPGSADGTGAEARFNLPSGIATDSGGNVYVTDAFNDIIRKITPAGVVSTLAGTAGRTNNTDGTGAAARFNLPWGVATDSSGNVYVADLGNQTIRKITPAGVVSTFAGAAGVSGSADGSGAAARFSNPEGIATDSGGNVYVADSLNSTIRKITPAGTVSTIAGTAGFAGNADGSGAAARFNHPTGVATDSSGNVYVADPNNQTIRKITPAGVVSTFAGSGAQGSADGSGAAAQFNSPGGIATDGDGNVYVADTGNQTIRKITPAGVVSTFAGTAGAQGSADGSGSAAQFSSPLGIAIDSGGNVYVVDSDNSIIRKITPAGAVSTLAGSIPVSGSTDGTGAAARFNFPAGIVVDSSGNVYVADDGNHTIRKITPAGVVSTSAGAAGVSGSTDGSDVAARFNRPIGMAIDSDGNVYVADTGNHTIRKMTPGGVVSTFAGTAGAQGNTDGTGAAARFNAPGGIATDSAGNVYVADFGNHIIREITPTGVVSTIAGTAGAPGSADGSGASARFNNPTGVAADSNGNIYVVDRGNSTIRKITPAGSVSTIAGTAGALGSADGAGAAARFNNPSSVATDSDGNVYVSDFGNHTIRKITPAGVVSTIVGVAGLSGFSPGPLPGVIGSPRGVAVSGSLLYFTKFHGVAVVTDRP